MGVESSSDAWRVRRGDGQPAALPSARRCDAHSPRALSCLGTAHGARSQRASRVQERRARHASPRSAGRSWLACRSASFSSCMFSEAAATLTFTASRLFVLLARPAEQQRRMRLAALEMAAVPRRGTVTQRLQPHAPQRHRALAASKSSAAAGRSSYTGLRPFDRLKGTALAFSRSLRLGSTLAAMCPGHLSSQGLRCDG